MGIWTNNDGLRIKIGASEANITQGGEYNVTGIHELEVRLNLASLGTASALVEPGVILPRGARIDSVETVVEAVATSGGAAALNVGLVRLDNTTAIDVDGLVAAAALTTLDAVGEKTAGAGALVGTVLTNPGKIVADYDTAAYTAGTVLVRVKFYVPIPTATNVGL